MKLNADREVEIDLTEPTKRRVTAFRRDEPVARTIVPAGEGLTLIGGDRNKQSAWFIAVGRDTPR